MGRRLTVGGGAGDDTIIGNAFADTIVGRDYIDVLKGGADTVAGSGTDVVRHDALFGCLEGLLGPSLPGTAFGPFEMW